MRTMYIVPAVLLMLWSLSAGAQTYIDPPIPEPSGAVRTRFDEIGLLIRNKQFDEALKATDTALETARGSKDLVGEARLLMERAQVLSLLRRREESVSVLREMERVWERASYGPGRVLALGQAALVLVSSNPDEAKSLLAQCVALAQSEQRWRLGAARAMIGSGSVFLVIRQFEEGQILFEASLKIQETYAPGSRETAGTLRYLGDARRAQGDLRQAEDCYKRSMGIEETLSAGSPEVADCLNRLGVARSEQGDLAQAEVYCKQALEIYERKSSESLDVAKSFNNLGIVWCTQGDFARAEDYFNRALKIYEKQTPGSANVARGLLNRGNVWRLQGHLQQAKDNYKQALEIYETLSPGSPEGADCLNNLGIVWSEQGDLAQAEDYYEQALEIYKKKAPGSVNMASSLLDLGNVWGARGDLGRAEAYYRRALAILEKQAPGSLEVTRNLHALGSLLLQQSHPQQALALLQQAVEIVERQRGQIRSLDARLLLTEQHTDRYAALVRCYLALHQPANAFATLERARARSFADRLATRPPDLSRFATPQLLQAQRRLDNQRRIAYASLTRALQREDTAAQTQARQTIDQLALQQRELEETIRRQAPRLAAIDYPRPLTLAQAQKALDPGTLLLTYAVQEKQSVLFALTRTQLHVYSLPLAAKALQAHVLALRKALHEAGGDFRPEARALYDQLLRPAQAQIASAKRLLVCPDGVLHRLPFPALLDHTGATERFLVQSKPLHTVLSMTAYAQLRASASPPPLPHIVALADPLYPPRSPATRLKAMGLELAPLPATRQQVQALVGLYGGQTVALLGAKATRSQVMQQAGTARILHLACHGWADNQDPLGSALALTPEGRGDDGFLRAWEVLEKLPLGAELVTLSACETGLGTETRSEGIVGLTRAFQLAGARSVLMSLWSIKDLSTNALMRAFYRNLRAGRSKDEALRQAQLTLLHSERYRDPHYWAPFLLSGDYK